MRGQRTATRGEAARVAERVRALLGEHDDDAAPSDAVQAWTREARSDARWAGGDWAEGGVTNAAVGHRSGANDRHEPDEGDDDVGNELGFGERVGDRAGGRRGGARPTFGQRLAARVPLRLDPGRRAALGVGLAVILAAVVTGVWLMASRPQAVPVAARVPRVPGSSLVGTGAPAPGSGESSGTGSAAASPSAAAPAAPSSTAGVVVVDVAGKVRHPGLYRLPSGSRIDDAIRAAGGARSGVDLSSLNLAAPLSDGQQIAVGLPGAAVSGGGVPVGSAAGGVSGGGGSATGAGGSAAVGTPVNLNTATLEQLDSLPGVGPVLAQHILDWRSQHGRFTGVDQLNDVSGIGDVKFAGLRDLVTV